MQEIADWLAKLGLSEYAQRFAENGIDVSVLRHLSDQDLKEVGVLLGHRRKMLAAIAELASAPQPAAEPAAADQATRREAAERRQVTVMFSDLVGSTALSARMDPEDLGEVISAYHKCVAETVRRCGGFVANYMGDGVLVYFGYPQAHEDDAERAVRAGLDVVAAVNGLTTRAALQARVGIATGLVVVGDLIGSGETQERGIVGETPNLAARLQTVAQPNTVVIAEGTRRLLGSLFELQDLGPLDVKGISGPLRAWAVLRLGTAESRFEAMHAAGLTALIGREEESELLQRRWAKAKDGEGQVVLLSGEGGIGKSRLTAALLERLAAEPHARLRYFCSPQHTDSAFYPIIGQLERAAGLAHDDTAAAKLDKLDALLAQSETSLRDATLFAELLSLPNDGRYPALPLSAQQRRQATLEALNAQIETLSRSAPVLMIFEDAHWIDPTSLEALGRVVAQIAALPVLLLVSFRPEFQAPWIGRPHVTALTISRLARRDIEAMIDRVLGNKAIPANIRHDIIERTDGVPLFVEEMTKAVLEAEVEGEGQRTIAAVPLPALAVPASLHASLMARLDRLGPAKEIAQIGSAIGREFSHNLLAAVVRKPDAELGAALDRLTGSGLLFRQGVPPQATYLFKHALVQDAAYGTLLREPRRALHARIAEVLERQFPDIADSRPELLARHCTEAGLIEKAAGLWGKAGQRSLERSALAEAAEQLRRALTQIAALPPTPASRRDEIELQVALITPLIHLHGFAASETQAAVERARVLIEQAEELGEPPDDPLLLFLVLYGIWSASYVAFNGDTMRELAGEFLTLAGKQGSPIPRMIGHRIMGTSLLCTGDIAQARAHEDKGIALYNPAAHRPLAIRFGQDARVVMMLYRAIASWLLGHADAALADKTQAVADARSIGQAGTMMFALLHGSFVDILCGNYAAVNAATAELVALAEQKSALFWKAMGMSFQGCLCALTGKAAEAVAMITSGIAALRSTGATLWIPAVLSYLARAHAELGQFEEAWHCIGEALAMVEATKESWYEAEIKRVAGEIALLSAGDSAKAQIHFERALTVAREQQAKAWELRAAMSLARLQRQQGRHDEARASLAPVYGSFTEGFDTLDLRQGKVLLEDLKASN